MGRGRAFSSCFWELSIGGVLLTGLLWLCSAEEVLLFSRPLKSFMKLIKSPQRVKENEGTIPEGVVETSRQQGRANERPFSMATGQIFKFSCPPVPARSLFFTWNQSVEGY